MEEKSEKQKGQLKKNKVWSLLGDGFANNRLGAHHVDASVDKIERKRTISVSRVSLRIDFLRVCFLYTRKTKLVSAPFTIYSV